MRIDRALLLAAALSLAAPLGVQAQVAPAPASKPKPPAAQPKPPPAQPKPPPAQPRPPAPPPKAQPEPAPAPPPAAHPEDEAIIEQLELFMLMEMLKDYEILQEPDK